VFRDIRLGTIMDPAIKTALAFCVLLGGACMAMLFRHDQKPRSTSSECRLDEELLLRARADAAGSRLPTPIPLRQPQPSSDIARPATFVTPLDRREPPPALSPAYPETAYPAGPRWGVSMEMMLPMAAPTDGTARTHTVVDGDTLAALAQRYLGSPARADELYEANRDVVHDPKLLPIGVELKLPRRDAATAR
jgi:hypothetical protein